MAPDPFVSGSRSPSLQEQHELPVLRFVMIRSKSGLTTCSGGIPISVILPSCCLEGVKHDQTTNICSLLRQIALAQMKWKFGNKALDTLTKRLGLEKDHLRRFLLFYFPTGVGQGGDGTILKHSAVGWNVKIRFAILAGISEGLPIAKAANANKDIPRIPLQPPGEILLFWLSADVSFGGNPTIFHIFFWVWKWSPVGPTTKFKLLNPAWSASTRYAFLRRSHEYKIHLMEIETIIHVLSDFHDCLTRTPFLSYEWTLSVV